MGRTKSIEEPTRIWFDGGCRPNPGPIETAVVIRGETHVRTDHGVGDNGMAEWAALIDAARAAAALGLDDVILIGDSRGVIEQARGAWPCRSAALREARDRFIAVAAGIGRVRLRHVRRSHNLAGIALDRRLR